MTTERWPSEMAFEIREEGGAPLIVGYAAVFNSMSEDLGGFREVIAPGAFADSLGGDVRALWSHDPAIVLGRTTAGTLRIAEDRKGLRVEIKPPSSAAGYVESIRRGDVSQMSFGFTVEKDDWTRAQDGTTVRTLQRVNLKEVSPVAFPAYQASSVAVRGLYGALPDIPELMRRAPLTDTAKSQGRAPLAAAIETRNQQGGKMENRLTPVDMRRKASYYIERAEQLDALANAENRTLSEDERGEYDNCIAEQRRLEEAATRAEQLGKVGKPIENGAAIPVPNINLGNNAQRNEERATAHWYRTGDATKLLQLRASNAVDMVEGTPGAGGYAVPVGQYRSIIAKLGNYAVHDRLGVRRIPGKGATVNVPVELASGTVNPFIATAEKTAKDKDSPQLGQVAMTLQKFTKVVPMSTELLEDEDSNLLAFVEDYVARAMADTYNTALHAAAIRTAAPIGFTLIALGAGAGPVDTDIPTVYYGLREPYAERGKWLMRRSTEGGYRALKGAQFQYMPSPQGTTDTLWGAPVYNIIDLPAQALNAKVMIFADWSFMGMREGQSIGMLRDPYSRVLENVVQFVYEFRVCFAVLQTEAGLIGQRPAA